MINEGLLWDSVQIEPNSSHLSEMSEIGETDTQKVADCSKSGDDLLSFQPFCPGSFSPDKKIHWITRKLKSAGSSLRSRRKSLSRYSQNASQSSIVDILPPGCDTGNKGSVHAEIDGEENIYQDVEVLSYFSVRSEIKDSLSPTPSVEGSLHMSNESKESTLHQVSAENAHDLTALNEMSSTIIRSDDCIYSSNAVTLSSDPKKEIEVDEKDSKLAEEQTTSTSTEFEQYLENCSKTARQYVESAEFEYDKFLSKTQFDPKSFNFSASSPLNCVKLTDHQRELLEKPKQCIDSEITQRQCNNNDHEPLPKKVGFVTDDAFEIQAFDENQPTTSTVRSKSRSASLRRNSCLKKNSPPKQSSEIDSLVRKDEPTLGPVPFPDSVLKEKMNGLFELVGAPKQLEECNDLRLCLYCFQPCLTRFLGFLWDVIRNGKKENDFLRVAIKRLDEKRLSDAAMNDGKQQEYAKLASIHVDKLNQLEKTVQELTIKYSRSKAHNNAEVSKLNNAIESMTGVLKEFFSQEFYNQWEQDCKTRIDGLMAYLNDICDYFSTIQENMIVQVEHDAEARKTKELFEFYSENCTLLQRENETLKAVASAYKQLQSIVTEKNIIINSMKEEICSLKGSNKDLKDQLKNCMHRHQKELTKLAKLSEKDRNRALNFWDKTDYERALQEKEEVVLRLQDRISLLESTVNNKDVELRNVNARYAGLGTKVAIFSNENIVLKTERNELMEQQRKIVETHDARLLKELHIMKRTMEHERLTHLSEMSICRNDYERALNQALEVTVRAEALLQSLSNGRHTSSARNLKYFADKKELLQKLKERQADIRITCFSDQTPENAAPNAINTDLDFVADCKEQLQDSLAQLRLRNVNTASCSKGNSIRQRMHKLRKARTTPEDTQHANSKQKSGCKGSGECSWSATARIAEVFS